MLAISKKEFWFVVGSQHLYGEEALQEVRDHTAEMVKRLNDSGNLPYPVVFTRIGSHCGHDYKDHEGSQLSG